MIGRIGIADSTALDEPRYRSHAAANTGSMPMANADNSNPVFATSFLLLAQYGGKAVIPLECVRRDYFPHLTIDSLLRKTTSGELSLPIVRIEDTGSFVRRERAAS